MHRTLTLFKILIYYHICVGAKSNQKCYYQTKIEKEKKTNKIKINISSILLSVVDVIEKIMPI